MAILPLKPSLVLDSYLTELRKQHEHVLYFIRESLYLRQKQETIKTQVVDDTPDEEPPKTDTFTRWFYLALLGVVYFTDFFALAFFLDYFFSLYLPTLLVWIGKLIAPLVLLAAYLGLIRFNIKQEAQNDAALLKEESDRSDNQGVPISEQYQPPRSLFMSRIAKFSPLVAPLGGIVGQIVINIGHDNLSVIVYLCLGALVAVSHCAFLFNGEDVWQAFTDFFADREASSESQAPENNSRELQEHLMNFNLSFTDLARTYAQFKHKHPDHPYQPLFSKDDRTFIEEFYDVELDFSKPETFLNLINNHSLMHKSTNGVS